MPLLHVFLMARKYFGYLLAFLLLLSLFAPVINSVLAGPEDILWSKARPFRAISPLIPESGIMFHAPIAKTLSGSAERVVTGQDYRFDNAKKQAIEDWKNNPGDVIMQAAGGVALVPYRDPSQKFSRNILITRDYGNVPVQTEPAMAVNPNDPDHIVVGTIDYNFANVVSYVSIDGGQSWQGAFQSKYLSGDLGAAGDPILTFDRKGNVYMGCISIGSEDFNLGGVPFQEVVSSISITRSSDGGETWQQPISSARSSITLNVQQTEAGGNLNITSSGGTLKFGFLDKPWIASGPNPENLDEDIIYVVYTHFVTRYDFSFALGGAFLYFRNPVLETTIELVKSDDYGQTWSDPIAVSPTVFSTYSAGGGEGQFENEQDRVVQFPHVFTGLDGTAYIGYLDSTDDGPFEGIAEIHIARSDDGGDSISTNNRVSTFNEPFYRSRNAPFRSWATAFPRGDVSDIDGSISLTFGGRPSDKPTDDGDIFFTRSTDRGESWSLPKTINDDTGNSFQFFPTLDIDKNGIIHAFFGDFRDSPSEIKYHMYYTRSEDNGNTWLPNSRITDFPTNPNRAFPSGAFIGDYNEIKATGDEVYMVWTDGRLGEFGGFNQKIAFARTSPMPTPSIFLSPPNGPGGRDVQISGFDFQPDQAIYITVSGVIVSTTRTDENGLFNTRIFIPIAGQGAHSVTAIEASGNVATASFYMDFGFDNLASLSGLLKTSSSSIIDTLQNFTNSFSMNVAPSSPQVSEDLSSLQGLPDQIQRLQDDINSISTKTENFQTVLYTIVASLIAVLVLAFISLNKTKTLTSKKIRRLFKN